MPVTAVRTAVSAGRVRPSGPKLCVQSTHWYAFSQMRLQPRADHCFGFPPPPGLLCTATYLHVCSATHATSTPWTLHRPTLKRSRHARRETPMSTAAPYVLQGELPPIAARARAVIRSQGAAGGRGGQRFPRGRLAPYDQPMVARQDGLPRTAFPWPDGDGRLFASSLGGHPDSDG